MVVVVVVVVVVVLVCGLHPTCTSIYLLEEKITDQVDIGKICR